MPRVCTVCTHPKRAEIDHDLVHGVAAKRRIAARHSLSETSLRWHEARHLDPALIEAHNRSLEAEADSNYRLARDNVNDALADIRSMREAFTVNGKVIPHRDMLEIMDRFLKANEQWARINREVGSDTTLVLLANYGLKSEAELGSRLEISRRAEDLSLPECFETGMELLEMCVAQDGKLRQAALERLGHTSYALEVHVNGTEASQSHQHPAVNGTQSPEP